MGLFGSSKLGQRVLRIGSRGSDVKQLQQYLCEQGYDIGGTEEQFGYLTKDALEQFQRDHGLVADGIAGKQVYTLIQEGRLPQNRHVHTVIQGETLTEIATNYGIGREAFEQCNKTHALYPGQRLVFFNREVWAHATNKHNATPDLTGVFVSVDLDEGASPPENPCGSIPICIPQVVIGSSDPILTVHQLVATYRRRRKTAERLLQLAQNSPGICLAWTNIARVDGVRYMKLLQGIRRGLTKEQRLVVYLGENVPRWNLLGGIDYQALNDIVDNVILPLPIPDSPRDYLGKSQVEKMLWPILSGINSWKIILQVPVYAVQWQMSDSNGEMPKPAYLNHSDAMSQIYRHNARAHQDDTGGSYYQYYYKKQEYHLRIAHQALLNQVIATVNRYNLAGVLIDRLGMEDPRLWKLIRNHFRTAQF